MWPLVTFDEPNTKSIFVSEDGNIYLFGGIRFCRIGKLADAQEIRENGNNDHLKSSVLCLKLEAPFIFCTKIIGYPKKFLTCTGYGFSFLEDQDTVGLLSHQNMLKLTDNLCEVAPDGTTTSAENKYSFTGGDCEFHGKNPDGDNLRPHCVSGLASNSPWCSVFHRQRVVRIIISPQGQIVGVVHLPSIEAVALEFIGIEKYKIIIHRQRLQLPSFLISILNSQTLVEFN
ncbi:hypothetical protein NHQ30_002830 [Ciborinia camelliae]|nr:hypothetical protein NHQ30_002830 [Ciborinia camelliae]